MLFLFISILTATTFPKAIRISPVSDQNLELSPVTLELIEKKAGSENFFVKEDENGVGGSYLKTGDSFVWKEGKKLIFSKESCEECIWEFNPVNNNQSLIGREGFCWKKDMHSIVLATCPNNNSQKKNNGGVSTDAKDSGGKGFENNGGKSPGDGDKSSKAPSDKNNSQNQPVGSKNDKQPEKENVPTGVENLRGMKSRLKNTDEENPDPEKSSGRSSFGNSNVDDIDFLWKITFEKLPSRRVVNEILRNELARNEEEKKANPGAWCGKEQNSTSPGHKDNENYSNDNENKKLTDKNIPNKNTDDLDNKDSKPTDLKNENPVTDQQKPDEAGIKDNSPTSKSDTVNNKDSPVISPDINLPTEKPSIAIEIPQKDVVDAVTPLESASHIGDLAKSIPTAKKTAEHIPVNPNEHQDSLNILEKKQPTIKMEDLRSLEEKVGDITDSIKNIVSSLEGLKK